jgi:peptidoglycan/LPS O-acetylase OafA/YrhL
MHQPQPTFHYRSDIDGLRALAVLAVLGSHMAVRRLTGGFVGVDVFFVISGYLISSIIFRDIAAAGFSNHGFSVLKFYERRIRRIFPALFCMLLTFSLVASIYFLPHELVDFGKSLIASTLSVSNIYLWQHSGYFDSPLTNPLLHTWSLAVEEQFYLLFPVLLFIVHKFAARSSAPRLLKAAVITLFLLSFLTSALTVRHNPNTAFYMPWTRAWELLLGTLLSLKILPPIASPLLRNLAALTGLAMVAFAILTYTPSTVFPGPSALLPCVGAALIIAAGETGTSLVGSMLSLRPVVFIGLISYSLYLWHWPVIILHKMGILFAMASTLPQPLLNRISPQHYDILVELSTSLILGTLSWRFVERPFRSGVLRLSGRPLFALAGGTLALFVVPGIAAILSNGFQARFNPQSVHLASYLDNQSEAATMRLGSCFLTPANKPADYNATLCLHPDPSRRNFLLLGDSHSAMLYPGLASVLPGVNLMQTSISGCDPLIHPTGSPLCRQMMHFIYSTWLPQHPVQGLLLQARWEPYELPALADTLTWARTHHVPVILFGPAPEYDAPLPRLEAYSVAWREPNLAQQHRLAGTDTLDASLQHLASADHVPYISLYQAICDPATCTEFSDPTHTTPLMFDSNHLSAQGSLLVAHRLLERGDLTLSAHTD